MDKEIQHLIMELELTRFQMDIQIAEANLAFWRTFIIAVVVQATVLFGLILWLD